MARQKGTLILGSNIENNASAPLDARALVKTKAELTDAGSFPYFYQGMIVSVQSEGKAYLLIGNDPTIAANWKELGGGGGGGGSTAGSIYTGTLTSSGWNSSNQQTVTFTDYDDDYNGVVGVPSDATDAQKDAYKDAIISVVSQSGDTVTFKAETVPSINLPVAIYCGGGDGSGVPAGGTTGQALVKKSSTDGDVEWTTINSIPTGGTTGQVLAKKSNTDKDVEWKDDSAGHKILDTDATAMTQREKLQFTGLDVADDSTSNKTEVKPFGLNSDDLDEIIDTSEISNGYVQSQFNYSTEEQVIGKWVDGKPLYQKVLSTTLGVANAVKTIPLNISIGFFQYQSFVTRSDLYQEQWENLLSIGTLWLDNNVINIQHTRTDYNNKYIIIIIQYTKTTD